MSAWRMTTKKKKERKKTLRWSHRQSFKTAGKGPSQGVPLPCLYLLLGLNGLLEAQTDRKCHLAALP